MRLDKGVGRRTRIKLLAQLPYADVDDAVSRAVRGAPDALLELVSAEHASATTGERDEQPKLPHGELGIDPGALSVLDEHAVRAEIDADARRLNRLLIALGLWHRRAPRSP